MNCIGCKFHDDYTSVCFCAESEHRADFVDCGCGCYKMRDTETLGERMKLWREHNEMNLSDVSRHAFVTRTTMYNYERGISLPCIDVVVRICDMYGLSIDDYVGR